MFGRSKARRRGSNKTESKSEEAILSAANQQQQQQQQHSANSSTHSDNARQPPQRSASQRSGLDGSSDGNNSRTPETATLSVSNDNIVDECPISPLDEEVFPMTPADGISEIVLEDLMQRGFQFQEQERKMDTNNNTKLLPPPTVEEESESVFTQNGSLFDGAESPYEGYAESVHTDMSVAQSAADSVSTVLPDERGMQHRQHNTIVREETNCLVTFQRLHETATIHQTTLHARAEDTMADLVRRLQKSASGVLTFAKKELKRLQRGSRQIVFILPQCQRASFSKDEFGQMKVSDMMKLITDVRPIVVEVSLERTVSGEQIDIF